MWVLIAAWLRCWHLYGSPLHWALWEPDNQVCVSELLIQVFGAPRILIDGPLMVVELLWVCVLDLSFTSNEAKTAHLSRHTFAVSQSDCGH